ncbi:MAG TPA: N-acetylmuramoyl-L-alanine amidase [Crocinitomicaceae bacterium]|nr:N-acetylmuramoyl-L-alanine amidase [Crocinitomicaceae bacterium]
MIQELYKVSSVLEASMFEDSDYMNLIALAEEHPTSTSEQELRAYFQQSRITRKITHAVVHCAATQPTATVSSILNYWKNTLKWKNPGYHILIGTKGFTVLTEFNNLSNGAVGYNATGVHFSYIGGIDKTGKPLDTRTDLQKQLMQVCLEEIKKKYPNIHIIGHNEVANKACPSFKVKQVYPTFWTGK